MKLRFRVLIGVLAATAALGGIALAAAPPSAKTKGTSSVTDTSATLHGTVNPNGAATTYHFEWGTTTSYGSKSADASAGSGTTVIKVSHEVHGLTPGVTYHYRLVASNSAGTSDGADHTFVAGHPSPTVSTGSATELSTSGATLTGTVNPNGETTRWYFQWGDIHGLSQQTAQQSLGSLSSPQAVSWSLKGLLKAGTVYEYQLVAMHPKGVKTYGSTAMFMTYPLVRPYAHVSQTTRPRHDPSRPYVLTTSGKVSGPDWMPSQFACRGEVTVRFYRGKRQVRFRTARVHSNCTFSRRTVFWRTPGGPAPARLRVVVHFVSTHYLARNHGTTRYVTLG